MEQSPFVTQRWRISRKMVQSRTIASNFHIFKNQADLISSYGKIFNLLILQDGKKHARVSCDCSGSGGYFPPVFSCEYQLGFCEGKGKHILKHCPAKRMNTFQIAGMDKYSHDIATSLIQHVDQFVGRRAVKISREFQVQIFFVLMTKNSKIGSHCLSSLFSGFSVFLRQMGKSPLLKDVIPNPVLLFPVFISQCIKTINGVKSVFMDGKNLLCR